MAVALDELGLMAGASSQVPQVTASSPRGVPIIEMLTLLQMNILTLSLLPAPATSCDQSEIVSYLLTLPALNRTLKDCDGCLAVEVTSDPKIRKMFEDAEVEN